MTASNHEPGNVPPRLRPQAGGEPALAGLICGAALFSALVNLLMLTGPLFMLQLYDRVLVSRSTATLAVLFALVVFLHAGMAVLDHARGRIMARVGVLVQDRFEAPVLAGLSGTGLATGGSGQAWPSPRDLDAVRRFLAGPGALALADLPWAPVFIGLIFLLHVELGLLALASAGLLTLVALAGQWAARPGAQAAQAAAARADDCLRGLTAGEEALATTGGRAPLARRWREARAALTGAELSAGDRMGLAASLGRSLRLLAQSAMLALGGWLVLRDEIGAGVMIAASIVLGRALAPLEPAITQWEGLRAARDGWRRLRGAAVEHERKEAPRAAPCLAPAGLSVQAVSVVPPGGQRIVLRLAGFNLAPGQALGVIGPTGAGKTALARVAAGIWPAHGGTVRLGGVPLHRIDAEAREALIGYLPQRPAFLPGTLAEVIARGAGSADPGLLRAAIAAAGIADLVEALPDGAETRIDATGAPLSSGQARRVALARALYGAPPLLVLDGPDADLDAEGEAALNTAIRAARTRGAVVLVAAHRPAAVAECDMLMVLDRGAQTALGPREEVLRGQLRNHAELIRASRPAVSAGGGSAAVQAAAARPAAGAWPGAGDAL